MAASIEECALKFVADLRVLMSDYEADAARLESREGKAVRELEEKLKRARVSRDQSVRELNEKYAARVREAVRLRARHAEHPEDIAAAEAITLIMLGGVGGGVVCAADPDNARRRLQQLADDRERGEQLIRSFGECRAVVW